MYEKGLGVTQDYVLAHMWINLATSNGEEDAIENRNMVEKKMTPSQIEKAQNSQETGNQPPSNPLSPPQTSQDSINTVFLSYE